MSWLTLGDVRSGGLGCAACSTPMLLGSLGAVGPGFTSYTYADEGQRALDRSTFAMFLSVADSVAGAPRHIEPATLFLPRFVWPEDVTRASGLIDNMASIASAYIHPGLKAQAVEIVAALRKSVPDPTAEPVFISAIVNAARINGGKWLDLAQVTAAGRAQLATFVDSEDQRRTDFLANRKADYCSNPMNALPLIGDGPVQFLWACTEIPWYVKAGGIAVALGVLWRIKRAILG